MMKATLLLVLLLNAFAALSCPMCNIHNYLYSSVKSSKNIYTARVLNATAPDRANVQIEAVLIKEANSELVVGKTLDVYLYSAEKHENDTFIFSDPRTHGVQFDILDVRHEWEVRYLMDSTRVVSSVSEAIQLLEGVSTKSNADGLDYLKIHLEEARIPLQQRIAALRAECQTKPEDFYHAYRLGNLARALLQVCDATNLAFIQEELKAIAAIDPGIVSVDKLHLYYKPSLGEYLHNYLLGATDSTIKKTLIAAYIQQINETSNASNSYLAYALGFEDLHYLDQLKLNETNRLAVVQGLIFTALWYDFYWQKKQLIPLIEKIQQLNTDQEMKQFIEKRFEEKK